MIALEAQPQQINDQFNQLTQPLQEEANAAMFGPSIEELRARYMAGERDFSDVPGYDPNYVPQATGENSTASQELVLVADADRYQRAAQAVLAPLVEGLMIHRHLQEIEMQRRLFEDFEDSETEDDQPKKK